MPTVSESGSPSVKVHFGARTLAARSPPLSRIAVCLRPNPRPVAPRTPAGLVARDGRPHEIPDPRPRDVPREQVAIPRVLAHARRERAPNVASPVARAHAPREVVVHLVTATTGTAENRDRPAFATTVMGERALAIDPAPRRVHAACRARSVRAEMASVPTKIGSDRLVAVRAVTRNRVVPVTRGPALDPTRETPVDRRATVPTTSSRAGAMSVTRENDRSEARVVVPAPRVVTIVGPLVAMIDGPRVHVNQANGAKSAALATVLGASPHPPRVPVHEIRHVPRVR